MKNKRPFSQGPNVRGYGLAVNLTRKSFKIRIICVLSASKSIGFESFLTIYVKDAQLMSTEAEKRFSLLHADSCRNVPLREG